MNKLFIDANSVKVKGDTLGILTYNFQGSVAQ